MKRTGWIEVDLRGLERLLARRGKEFIIHELVQNAWDEQPTIVTISLPPPQNGRTRLLVRDDSPKGFRNLNDAFTLFAESHKKTNAEQRGTFNAGEKFVLAFCDQARVISTTGGIVFDERGRRQTRRRTERGSEFSGVLRINVPEWEHICHAVHMLIPPVTTVFNDEPIVPRTPIHTFTALLPTVEADEQGNLRRRTRKTEVRVYEPQPGETATLYEMGLPVVQTGDKWHVEIQQKVPLNLERDNVSPAYLQSVRLAVLNQMSAYLSQTDASSTWVRQAAGDPRIEGGVFNGLMELRFGSKRVNQDPSDPEANLIAVSQGYSVISSASLSSEEWKNVRHFGSSLPAGRVTPSLRPFSKDGEPLQWLAASEKSASHDQFEAFAKELGADLIGRAITVAFANDLGWGFKGCYGDGRLIVNVPAHGQAWFHGPAERLLENWIPFLVHELAHDRVSGHLTEDYHRECCRLAGALARTMYLKPSMFNLSQINS
jgi:hypothetical protein